jgi:hypothetical protein
MSQPDGSSVAGSPQRVSYCPWDGYHFVLDEARCGICGQERAAIMVRNFSPLVFLYPCLQSNYLSPHIFHLTELIIFSFHATQQLGTNRPQKEPWKKVLYLKQPYEDNYVDKTFLGELRKNSASSFSLDSISFKNRLSGASTFESSMLASPRDFIATFLVVSCCICWFYL